MEGTILARIVHTGVLILLASACAMYLFLHDWSSTFYSAGIFFLVLLPTLLKNYLSIKIPIQLDAAIGAFTFLTLFLGVLQNFYGKYPLWDALLHFQSGFLLSIGGFVLFYIMDREDNKRLRLTPAFISFAAFNFSIAISVVWEIYEYIVDTHFGYNMQDGGNADTMQDLILNAIGATIIAVIAYFWMRHTRKMPMTETKVDA